MKKRWNSYWKIYCLFALLCLAAGAAFLLHTYRVVREYDRSQPERVVERVIDSFSTAVAQNTLPDALHFPDIVTTKFEGEHAIDLRQAYINTLTGDRTFTYRLKTGAGSDFTKVYTIYQQDTPVATLTLQGSNSRSKLFFFSMADWEVASLEPILTASLYSFRILIPEGIRAYFNDIEVGEEERIEAEGSIPTYEIKNLTTEPTIRFERTDGTALEYQLENNLVTPILFRYTFRLPDTLHVTCDGALIAGEETDNGQFFYDICTVTEPEILFSDGFGNTISYRGESEIPLYRYTVTLPDTYRLLIGEREIDTADATRTAHPDAADLILYAPDVSLPDLLTWEFSLLHDAAKVSVVAPSGERKEYTLASHTLTVTQPSGLSEIPEEIAAQIDVMEVAVLWSKFMTDDLEGARHGFDTIAAYLIRDSSYYRYAYQWATGVDISFTSVHTITGFTNKRLSNFIAYSDTCFSCDIYFEKNMRLYDSGGQGLFAGNRTDVFNSTVYFVYCDDTPNNGQDDPHWAIALMHDILEQSGRERNE